MSLAVAPMCRNLHVGAAMALTRIRHGQCSEGVAVGHPSVERCSVIRESAGAMKPKAIR